MRAEKQAVGLKSAGLFNKKKSCIKNKNSYMITRAMAFILFSWIGQTDLDAARGVPSAGIGPIGQAVNARKYDAVMLLSNYSTTENRRYFKWLKERGAPEIFLREVELSSPMNFGEIYPSVVRAVEEVLKAHGSQVSLVFHLSPGTSAMAAIWVIIAKTRFAAELIQSSPQHGVQTASVPFDISADYIPDLLRKPDEELVRLMQGLPSEAPEFDEIVHRCPAMSRAIAWARRVAPRDVPVLIQGESGTGKELLARAIHRSSARRNGPLVTINCGAIPSEIIESELFGHERGAFTGAFKERKGHFEEASGGTLFLDEVSELPRQAQVKLLRVLQEREVVRVGASKPRGVNVRIVAATNQDLIQEMNRGQFREDLFHRLAVAIIKLPPLRERGEDLGPLIVHLLEQVNKEFRNQPGHVDKKLSAGARSLLYRHPWPGNVRELLNTLQRAAIRSSQATIEEQDVREALLPTSSSMSDNVLNLPLGNGLNIRNLLAEVARHYLQRALEESHGNKTLAAELVGLPSYQTFTNWLDQYEAVARPLHTGRGRAKRI